MRERGAAWLLAGFVALTIFAATRTTLWDRDEARFGEAAGEMAANGNFLFPTFNGALRADKPILPYWVMAAGIGLLGRGALGVRIGSCLAAAAAAWAAAATARRLLPAGAAFWAVAMLVSSPLFLLEASAGTADAVLVAAIAAAMLGFARLIQERRLWPGAVLFGGASAAAA
ncbi:MAG TPA: glycosyltransferase family 39 protein, partial [Thermoanaerobaculia bacterium]|nr:glycosyltransferase family 39 protein [Thermoanaerobaculia bacterium]